MSEEMDGQGTPLAWPRSSVLVIEDEPGMGNFLVRSLARRFARVEAVDSVDGAEKFLARQRFDLIILDINRPGKSGAAWLSVLRDKGFAGDIILIAAVADPDAAIGVLRAGASDLLLKPVHLPQILNSIQRCHERSGLLRENFVLRREVSALTGAAEGLVGDSEAMRQARLALKRIAPTLSTVMIQGESGTGKEMAARVLHRMSPRAERPFVAVRCAGVGAEVMESELFGHVKGAGSDGRESREGIYRLAEGGTLFLDDVAALSVPLQAKLLRVLEERRIRPMGLRHDIAVDVRLIVATGRNLAKEVAAGRFRRDLHARLQVEEIRLPPLREHTADIPDLVEHFSLMLAPRLGVPPIEMPFNVLHVLMADYDWPGNVRELKNLVERSLIRGELLCDFLPAAKVATTGSAGNLSLDEMEKRHILAVLDAARGNKSEAARRLGVSRKTLERRCAAWSL
ncbi:MAG TPA: sigma-54 dependent transcriptional regulator [Rhodocyclaceae bacterium]|nr:sigma-54 dependent transcriptional regulator [Rhodocyclaceae bacterium]